MSLRRKKKRKQLITKIPFDRKIYGHKLSDLVKVQHEISKIFAGLVILFWWS